MPMFEVWYHTGDSRIKQLALVAASNRTKAQNRVMMRLSPAVQSKAVVIETRPVDEYADCVYHIQNRVHRAHVRIKSCSDDSYWYKNFVGKEYHGVVREDFATVINSGLVGNLVTDLFDVLGQENKTGVLVLHDCEILNWEPF